MNDTLFNGGKAAPVRDWARMEHTNYTELLERAKIESDRRVKAIFDGVRSFVVLMLIDGTVIEINQAALAFRGLKREAVTGSPLWDGPWFGDLHELRALVTEAAECAALGDAVAFEARIADPAGELRHFAATCGPVFGKGADVLYVLLEAHDMTDFVRVQARNRQLELEMMNNHKMESLGTLAGGIAHEINTPIQYIGDNLRFLADGVRDMLALLRDARALAQADADRGESPWSAWLEKAAAVDLDFLGDEAPKAVDQSTEGVERVCGIVRAVKNFSHPDSTEMSPQSLEKLAANTLTVSRNQWKYAARVETDFQPDMPPVPCHPGEISQVILNLVVNAAHAIEEKMGSGGETGVIRVSVFTRGDQAILQVADTGQGIRPEHRAKVFDLFFTTKDQGKGAGHGLSICHSIVTRKHGGTLTFETEVGVGTTFTVALPLTAAKPATENRTAV